MALKIVWTEPVLQDVKAIVDYIENEWSETLADKFIELLKDRIEVLSNHPFMGMASKKYSFVRSVKLSKHNKLYYRIDKGTLVLLSIFDTRQHPDKNIYD